MCFQPSMSSSTNANLNFLMILPSCCSTRSSYQREIVAEHLSSTSQAPISCRTRQITFGVQLLLHRRVVGFLEITDRSLQGVSIPGRYFCQPTRPLLFTKFCHSTSKTRPNLDERTASYTRCTADQYCQGTEETNSKYVGAELENEWARPVSTFLGRIIEII